MKNLSKIIFFSIILCLLFAVRQIYSDSNRPDSQTIRELKSRKTITKPKSIRLSSNSDIVRVIVKFKEGSEVELRGKSFVSDQQYSTTTLNDICKPYFNNNLNKLLNKSNKNLKNQKKAFETISGQQLADLSLYYKLDITDPIEAEQVVNKLNKLDIVEIAYPEPKSFPAGDISPPTPDYTAQQTYLGSAPNGVDIAYAHAFTGGDGTGVKIADVEQDWNESHEDLETAIGGTISGGNSTGATHGTAVLGELIAGDNGYGVTGICPGADIAMASSSYNGTIEAIMMAIDALQPGDIMLIELNTPGPRYDFEVRADQKGYVSLEYWQDRFDAFQYAWAKGIIVVEAAGNGWENLDDAIYENRFDTTFRNSHAIMVGAGAPPSGNFGTLNSRMEFSNYGERVNLQGDGEEVFTTGYGTYWNGDGDPNQYYIANFNGTSSASPIVAGALACLQGYYLETYGIPMTAEYARNILIATGSPQQGDSAGYHIGPKPNLAAAIPTLTFPPSMYLSPAVLDTVMENGTTSFTEIYLYNRNTTTAIDYSLAVDQDTEGQDQPEWITAIPLSGTIPANDSTLITIFLNSGEIESNDYGYKAITKINWGHTGLSLDSSLYHITFLDVPCSVDTTFAAQSSLEFGGPTFSWIDIVDEANLIPHTSFYSLEGDPLDDGTVGPITLPFNFPFYDSVYSKIYIGVNGALSFNEGNLNIDYHYDTLSIPSDIFRTFIPVFWNDFIMGTAFNANGDIYRYFSPTNDTLIVEWYHLGSYGGFNDTTSAFEAILTDDGNITLQYLNVGEQNLAETAIIGLDGQHCRGMTFVNSGFPAQNIVEDSTIINFIQQIQQPILAGDCNGNGDINILDVTYLISYLYKSGPAPNPLESGDPNCTITINILDVTYLISYLYKGGPAPCTYMP